MIYKMASRRILLSVFLCLLWAGGRASVQAQNLSTGSLRVTVKDPSGALIEGARLVLTDRQTNDVHRSATSGVGIAVIPYLNPSVYMLKVSRPGFSTREYPSITIESSQVTNLVVSLTVGSAQQTITVSGNTTPLLQTSSNALSTTFDLKEVHELPLSGRDALSLAFLVPGAVDNNFNNLPGGAVSVGSNGFSTETNRMKSGGFNTNGSVIENRLEDVQEMTVQTSQLNASFGGTSTMNIGFVTKRGTNRYHGQVFEDYRNDAMNANSWVNNASGLTRNKLIINEFGASVGGPILKDKLFFFASLSNFRQPLKTTVSTEVATPLALSGIYQYIPQGSSTVLEDNVLAAGANGDCSTCTATINPLIAQDLANIESTYHQSGATLTPVDLNHESLNFQNKGYLVQKFPTLRLDYNINPNLRWTGVVSESNSYQTASSPAPYPGPLYANQSGSSVTRGYQVATGFDWDVTPTLVNAFRVGYLYSSSISNSQGMNSPTPAMVEQGDLAFGFGLNSGVNGFNTLKGGYLYPVLGAKDDVSWQHGRHSFEFGGSTETEIDHYYNNQFVPYINVNSIATGDPVTNALVNSLVANAPSSAVGDIEGLYATLNGRMSSYSLGEFVNARTKQFEPNISFNLHERLTQSALFALDSWQLTPTLTLNYGLRWDFTGASKDETGFYTHPSVADLWGPTPVGDLFHPGALGGVQNPMEGPASEAYHPTYVHPQPNIGIAWNPRGEGDNWMDRLMGNGRTVLRASFTFKNYTEGAQNFWNFGSNNGANFNTYLYANPIAPGSGTPGAGFYNAGSVLLGGSLPQLASTSPIPYQPIITEASQGFSGTSFLTFNPHIKQPYVESWSVGVQRSLGQNNVLEVRYVGNVSRDQWLGVNYNEVNIFENGFLNNFVAAQENLKASNGTTFKGSHPTPIFDQAFASTGEAANYANGQFITYLQQGQAGAMANALAGSSSYLCSLVGASNFSPCGAAGATGSGSYPINFFQANPYATGQGAYEMSNGGYSNYNALQIDFRQRMWHGMQFDANYSWSHSLENNAQGSVTPGYYGGRGNSAPGTYYTLRDKHLNYFPSSYDVHNVLHVSGIYDLPFGRGQSWLNHNAVLNQMVGGWTIGMILTAQGGDPFLFTGGTQTYNQNDGGIRLIGVTRAQLQHQIRPRPVQGHAFVSLFDPKYILASGQANPNYITPNYQPGTIGTLMWLHAPKWVNTDLSLTKIFPIHNDVTFSLQGAFLNAFNHPAWTGMDTGVQDATFGTTSTTVNSPRNIEVRGSLRF